MLIQQTEENNATLSTLIFEHDRTSTLRQSAIPQELVDQIIDELRFDRESLKACAQTRKSWLHQSRTHLHRSVTLYHQYCRIHATQIDNASMLLDLPYIPKYTRHLILEGKTDYGLRDVKTDGADNEALFWRIVSLFSHVTSLRLTRLFWVSHSLENKDRLCRAFPSTIKLDVYMSDFADMQEFLSLLTGFPILARLKAERVLWFQTAEEWQNHSGSDTSSYRSLPSEAVLGSRLRSLKVQHNNALIMTDIARWLGTSRSIAIETLRLSPPDGDDFGALSLYCQTIGSTLRHLTLDLEFATKEETMVQGISFLCDLPHSTISQI